jgi:hypothetical protein
MGAIAAGWRQGCPEQCSRSGEMCSPRPFSLRLVLFESRAVSGGNRGLRADHAGGRAARYTPVADKRGHCGFVFAGGHRRQREHWLFLLADHRRATYPPRRRITAHVPHPPQLRRFLRFLREIVLSESAARLPRERATPSGDEPAGSFRFVRGNDLSADGGGQNHENRPASATSRPRPPSIICSISQGSRSRARR